MTGGDAPRVDLPAEHDVVVAGAGTAGLATAVLGGGGDVVGAADRGRDAFAIPLSARRPA